MRLVTAVLFSFVVLVLTLEVSALPDLEIDQSEEIVLVEQGTVVSNTLEISNMGDSTLTWTLCDSFKGKVVRDFESPWTSARSMRYDATRDCLWLSYYNDSNVKKVSTANGSILATKNMGSNCPYPYAIEIDNGYLWAPDYGNTRFVKFNLDTMAVVSTVPFPSGWTRAYGIAAGDGLFYATRYDYNYRGNIYRLNPTSGAVEQTFTDVEYFYYYYNHIGYTDGAIWFGAYYTPKNRLKKFNPANGKIRTEIEMPDWYESCYIRDQSVLTNGLAWVLTYRHDYHETSQSKCWIHLLDAAAMRHLSESADSGTVATSNATDVAVVFDGRGADSGIHRVGIKIESDGGTAEKPYVFVVHAPGPNGAPTANAGPDQVLDATAPTMEVTLDGSGSTDPNGDELTYLWTETTPTGTIEWATEAQPTIALGPGVHDLTLTVDDLRGGSDTDTVRITLRAPDIEVDDCYVLIPEGGGTAAGTVTVRNFGDQTLNWSVSETVALSQDSVVREFEVTWKSSYSTYAYPRTMAYDGTRGCLWVGYYYDDEVGQLNTNNGAVISTKALGSTHRMYALDMEGADLWVADYSTKNFKKFNLDTLANTQTINKPSSWSYGPGGLARDSGQFFAAEYYQYEFCRLNPSTGGIQATHDITPERIYYSYNGMDAVNGTVWYSAYNTPRNRLFARDGSSGNLLSTLEMDGWGENGYVYDVSFQSSNLCWLLTYNVKGDTKYWAHLVDLSAAGRFGKSASSGSTAAGGMSTFDVSMDTTGLTIGWYPVNLTFASNDPDEPEYEKQIIFIVHDPGPNHAPTANAGPDQVRDIPGMTAPFVLDLSGSGSSDPDGDTLFSSWTMDGGPIELTDKGLIELGGGTHTFELTVDDLRGGVDTDSFTMTVNARVVPDGAPQYFGPTRNGVFPATNWLENWPPIERWRAPYGYGYSGFVISEGRVYSGITETTCLDAETGAVLWQNRSPLIGKHDWNEGYSGLQAWPAADEQYVYTYFSDSTAAAKDKYTGSNIWQTSTYEYGNTSKDCGRGASVLVEGDLAIFGCVALNKHTGEFVFKFGSGTPHNCPSAFDYNGRRWLCRYGSTYDILTGNSSPFGSVGSSSGRGSMQPTWMGDRFYSIRGMKMIGSSAWLWNTSDYTTQYHIPIAYEGYGYYNESTSYHGDGSLRCIRLSDGALVYAATSEGGVCVADGYVVSSAGEIAVARAGASTFDMEGREIHAIPGLRAGGHAICPLIVGNCIYVKCGSWIVCLDCAYSAPVVRNRAGAWDETAGEAVLRGELVNTGGRTPVQGTVYWGLTDGGTNAGDWDTCTPIGEVVRGDFEHRLSGLPDNALIYYRWYAENSEGGTWADAPSVKLSTCPPSTVEGEAGLLLHWALDETSGLTAPDTSGNDYHGSLTTGSRGFTGCEWTNGVAGNALHFTDVEQRVRYRGTLYPALDEQWTLAAWIKAPTNTGDRSVMWLRKTDPSLGLPNNDELAVGWYKYSEVKLRDQARDGHWHHVAVVSTGPSEVDYYLDGVWLYRAGPRYYAYTFFELGGQNTGITYDDVRLYTRALSRPEIVALMGLCGGTETTDTLGATVAADDAEEASDGTVTLDGTELNLGEDGSGDSRLTGLRFAGLDVPRGASIVNAHVQLTAGDVPIAPRKLLSQGDLGPYRSKDQIGGATVSDQGRRLTLENGTVYKTHPIPAYTVTENTILALDFESSSQGGYQGIGLTTATNVNGGMAKLWGTDWHHRSQIYALNKAQPAVRASLEIEMNRFFSGTANYLVFGQDDVMAPSNAVSVFRNIRLYERGQEQSGVCVLRFHGEAADNASALSAASGNLSGRAPTDAGVFWDLDAWIPGARGAAQCSPNLGALIQEIVDRPGWDSGNAIVLLIDGDGRRVADAFDKTAGLPAVLSVEWTDATDVDGDFIPDAYERAAGSSPSGADPMGDGDGDGATTYGEYLAGTDAADPNSVLKLWLRTLPDARIVTEFDTFPAEGLGYDGLSRYYTLECRDTLPTGGSNTYTDVWVEDLNLPDGTREDTGNTAWTLDDPDVKMVLTNGSFRCSGSTVCWISEPIPVMSRRIRISTDARSEGNISSGDYIKLVCVADNKPEMVVAERWDNFNGGVWENLSWEGAPGMSIQVKVYVKTYRKGAHYFDNIRVETVHGPDWTPMPGVTDIRCDEADTIAHTNATPGATGFYRVKARLEQE